MTGKTRNFGALDGLFVGLLLVIFGGIVLHAPLTVIFGNLFPDASLFIKAWKEILMGIAAVVAAILLIRRKRLDILKQPLIPLIGLYALLHLLLIPAFPTETNATLAGLLIDLRYVFFFVLVYIAICLYPEKRRAFLGTIGAGALVVLTFALLQATVLPHDVLKHLGYGPSTIMPYLTVDENPEFVRINSTLRGPNPLGAYALIVLTLLLAFGLRGAHRQFKRPMLIVTLLGVGGIAALWASYSRSALVAAIAAIVLLLFMTAGKKLSKWAWLAVGIAVVAIGSGLFLMRDSYFVSNVILHENATTGAAISSNEGHVDSLSEGLNRLVRQPLGGGVGSTGSASLFSDQPLVIENQYLFVAHEAGWLGLALFIMISWKVLRGLWERRNDWLAVGVFVSGIGLMLIGLIQPVWVDDTVSIIWWGLAAVVIGGSHDRPVNKATKRAA